MANLEYMIAMRFHAVLIALKYGIKTLANIRQEEILSALRETREEN